jgi:hypothetical protein
MNDGNNTCLDYIEDIWTDMRPLSLHRATESARADRSASRPASEEDSF